jgi:hypothetical protein
MDDAFIKLVVFIVLAGISATLKKSAKPKNAESARTIQDVPANPPVLTEADQRYREVQEEIRRRIAQRNQGAPAQTTTATPNPAQNYRPSKQITAPLNRNPRELPQKKSSPAPRTPVVATTMKMDAIPVMANAPIAPAMPAYPSEAAAYALPKDSGDNAASSSTSPGGSNALRAILASPSAARQAFLLREIFGQPLGLRPMANGGLEDWN